MATQAAQPDPHLPQHRLWILILVLAAVVWVVSAILPYELSLIVAVFSFLIPFLYVSAVSPGTPGTRGISVTITYKEILALIPLIIVVYAVAKGVDPITLLEWWKQVK